MFCSQCGAKLKDGAKFCQSCGAMVKGATSNSSSIEIEKVDKKTPPFKPDKIDIPKVKFTEVIPPMFEWVRDFGEGLAAIQDVGDSGKTSVLGFINKKGEMVIKKDFRNAKSFSEGLCAVSDGKKWGFIDIEGNLVIPYDYNLDGDWFSMPGKFEKGYCLCKKNSQYVLLDKYGKETFFNGASYAYYDSKNGVVHITIGSENGLSTKDSKRGLYNVDGKEIISCVFSDNIYISDEIIKVNGNYYDMKGKKIDFEIINEETYNSFADGLLKIKNNNMYGYCDKNGKLVISCEYDDATDFSNGIAFVRKQSMWLCIDKSNNIISNSKICYSKIDVNRNGRAIVSLDDKKGIIDKYFHEISNIEYHNIYGFYDFNFSIFSSETDENYNSLTGVIDRNGKIIIPCKYDTVDMKNDAFDNGIIKITHNEKDIFFDLNTGQELFLPTKYDEIYSFNEGYAVVKKGDKYGYISCLPNAKALKKEKIGASTIDDQYLKNKEKEEKKAMAEMERKKAANYMKEGTIVEFGIYQGYPIQWRVLKNVKTRGTALLVSNNVLDFCSFDNSGYTKNTDGMGMIQRFIFDVSGGEEEIYTNDIVWADSYIRSWLNTKFFNNAFNDEEQQRILNTNINTTGKRSNHTRGGEDTADKVFLLSIEELKKYMYQGNDCIAIYNGYRQRWWLRSPGMDNETVASVNSNGYIEMNQYHFAKLGVRPVINIKY